MKFTNTPDTYGFVSKALHWSMALVMFGLVLVGFYMQSLPYSPQMLEIYALHKSFGLLILWMVGLRIVWRIGRKSPKSLGSHKMWERTLSKLVHFLLYVAMVGMPLSGWLMSSAGEYPVPFFGILMPDLVGKDPDLAKAMHSAHVYLGYLLIGAILLHAIGAFKHHFMDGDNTLKRMMVNPMRHVGPYVLVIIVGLFALATGKLYLAKEESKKEIEISTSVSEQTDIERTSVDYQWNIVKDQSQLTFSSSVYGTDFTGKFGSFDGVIVFNVDDLINSYADITIQMNDIDSGDSERDSQILGKDWFNIADHPVANFKTLSIKKMEEGKFIAVGNLTIKGISVPVSLPFKLDIVDIEGEGRRSFVEGELALNRLDFGLGGEQWTSGDSVGLEVIVGLKMVASSP